MANCKFQSVEVTFDLSPEIQRHNELIDTLKEMCQQYFLSNVSVLQNSKNAYFVSLEEKTCATTS